MKFSDPFLFLSISINILIFTSCCICKDANTFQPPNQSNCITNSKQIDDRYTLLLNSDSIIGLDKKELGHFIRIKLAKLYQKDTVTDRVMRICDCGNLVLMDKDSDIIPSDRVATARTRLEQSGDDAIQGIDYDYVLGLGFPYPEIEYKYKSIYDNNSTKPNSRKFPVKVAIIDSGMDYQHDDLVSNISVNERGAPIPESKQELCIKYNKYGVNILKPDSDNDDAAQDNLGHGTHVAGIVVGKDSYAVSNNRLNRDIGLLNIKVFDRDSSSLFSAICGIHYAIRMKAEIMNLSWGFYTPDKPVLLENAIKKAKENKIFIVAAAGNDSIDIDRCEFWPASFSTYYDNVIAVGAAEKNDKERYFFASDYSNYGIKTVNLTALGTGIRSTIPVKNKYGLLDGTSMASPAVSRYIAWLLLEKKGRDYYDVLRILDGLNTTNAPEVKGAEEKVEKSILVPLIPSNNN